MGCDDRESNHNNLVYVSEKEAWYASWGWACSLEAPTPDLIKDRLRDMNKQEADYTFKQLDNGKWLATPIKKG